MMRVLLFSFLIILSSVDAFSKEKGDGGYYLYFNQIMGHLHKSPSFKSSTLTTLQCAHAIRVLSKKEKNWLLVMVGEDQGYIHRKYLSEKRPRCFQEKYPFFFNSLDLTLTDYYFWGRLSDQYDSFKSRVH